LQLAMAAVTTAEQLSAFAALGNRTAGRAAAEMTLLALASDSSGAPLDTPLADAGWLAARAADAAAAAGNATSAAANDSASTAALAAAVRRVNAQAAQSQRGEDPVESLIRLAKAGHVADTSFAGNASLLGAGAITVAQFQCVPRPS
jgi:hypothetical protein